MSSWLLIILYEINMNIKIQKPTLGKAAGSSLSPSVSFVLMGAIIFDSKL
jgi:hypothetical protein